MTPKFWSTRTHRRFLGRSMFRISGLATEAMYIYNLDGIKILTLVNQGCDIFFPCFQQLARMCLTCVQWNSTQNHGPGNFHVKEKTESIVLVVAPKSIPVREKFPVDYLTVCGHKFYAPRIGALYHRRDTAPIHPLLFGGGQEFKRRPGTENTPMVVGLGKVIILSQKSLRSVVKLYVLGRFLAECFIKAVHMDKKLVLILRGFSYPP